MIMKGMKGMKATYIPTAHSFQFVPPERCDYDFVLNRAYVNGITETLYMQLEGRKQIKLNEKRPRTGKN